MRDKYISYSHYHAKVHSFKNRMCELNRFGGMRLNRKYGLRNKMGYIYTGNNSGRDVLIDTHQI